MQALLHGIPHDADYDAEIWTTVDMNRTNVRAKAVSKILQGFSLYMVLMGKNFILEARTEARYRDLLIVCNVQASSGPVDLEGLYYRVNSSASKGSKSGRGGGGAAAAAAAAALGSSSSKKRKNTRCDTLEMFEDGMDLDIFRQGVIRSNGNPKGKNKVCACVNVCDGVCVRER